MVMAGGGFRFGYYLGMYAAAVEMGRPPGLLLASCGGAIAGALIQSLPTDEERRAFVASPAMYDFLRALASTRKAAIGRALFHAIRRGVDKSSAPRIPDLFNDYLFDIPAALPLPPPSADPAVALAIVGARLLYEPEEVGQPRAGRKLFAETVFCAPRAAALLDGAQCPTAAPGNAIATHLQTDSAMPLADAVRISIADMVYFRCHAHGAHHYTGGVVDLFPIELAHRMAHSVMIERKSAFDIPLAIPALRSVLGIDGNARLRQVHAQHADVWVDTSDMSEALQGRGVGKRLDWGRMRIALHLPGGHAAYAEHVDAQWRYGYERMREALQGERRMRNRSRHNWTAP